ncbi:8-oxo-dGTP pyrophosphatase MutT (NUDIX family) [Croceifilum oryzae]|uniref:8-oxo-dGTP pyrophosphatase MutT (NUDIX family) n=1 Tax=Croceifilum oryzae TaxID=1553429 RepID=A0AAJ1WRE6_9BACL|nr:NUDIX domain-containing protein [Croceifilum oryzae]MDQ0416243.1 8-oxo-dGTP pyrophosphatase MutT (NUDIX family) [Croceifilum oryzae]
MQEISAGGVVYRVNQEGYQILLIHDRYGKMTLPKGKREGLETEEENALREVLEETNVKGQITQKLHTIHYTYQHPLHGEIEKTVHYYLIEAIEGEIKPQLEEIQHVGWYSVEEAYLTQKEKGYPNNHIIFDKAYDALQLNKGV